MSYQALRNMLQELNENKVYPSYVVFETMGKNQKLDVQKLNTHLLIVLEGSLHLENKNSQILQFFVPGNTIHQSPFVMNAQDSLKVMSDCESEIVLVHREFFLNFASNKIEYMEWLLEAVTENSSAFCFELMKFNLLPEKRIIYTLQTFCKKIHAREDSGYFKLPDFITKTMLSRYGGVSRKTLDKILVDLAEQRLLIKQDDTFFVKRHFDNEKSSVSATK